MRSLPGAGRGEEGGSGEGAGRAAPFPGEAGERRPQLPAGAQGTGLDGALGDAEQGGGLPGGQPVDHGGAQHLPQFGAEPAEGGADVAELQAVHAARSVQSVQSVQDTVLGRGGGRRGDRRVPFGALACPQGVDEPPGGDGPQPAAGLAAPVGAGRAPDGDEGVLEDLPDRLRVGAAARQTDLEPAGVPVVEAGQGRLVARGDGAQQRRVVLLRCPHGAEQSHVPSIDGRGADGSR
ncbi:hypothetical protein MTP02_15530 [Streptomyces albus]|nr:hypothetical protein MTP02_15530 [Streptomyces albus]